MVPIVEPSVAPLLCLFLALTPWLILVPILLVWRKHTLNNYEKRSPSVERFLLQHRDATWSNRLLRWCSTWFEGAQLPNIEVLRVRPNPLGYGATFDHGMVRALENTLNFCISSHEFNNTELLRTYRRRNYDFAQLRPALTVVKNQ